MISLIISFYKRIDFLELILQAVERQSYRDFEVIISEDDNAEETVLFLDKARKQFTYPIKHVSQEDIGFRKTKILNAAILAASGEQIVFLDGDCIPHKHFLKEYAKAIQEKEMCFGRRTYLSEKITSRLLNEQSIKNLRFFKILFAGSKFIKYAVYIPFYQNIRKERIILGCNWGILRKHILEVNGFDEDFTRAGAGEDIDITWRLKQIGLYRKQMKHRSVVYHLYHGANYSNEDNIVMLDLMKEKMKIGKAYCVNGINK
jgi:glycosyltransferase involved in cell wall biosynthesis